MNLQKLNKIFKDHIFEVIETENNPPKFRIQVYKNPSFKMKISQKDDPMIYDTPEEAKETADILNEWSRN